MNGRVLALGAALALLWLPAAVRGQSAEHDEVEVIEPPEKVPAQKADTDRVAKQIVEQTNAFRKEQGRKPVAVNKELTEAATAFARFMAKKDRYGHTADGRRPSDRVKKAGYDYCIVLENIAYEYNSRDFETDDLSKQFVQAWEHSPGHRRNMLDPDVVHTGVGVARSEKTGYYYAVQTFGRPHSMAIEFRIANRTGEEVSYQIAGKKFRLGPNYVRTHTRCRPTEVTFAPATQKQKPTTVKPANGDRFVVTSSDEGYEVKKE